MKLDRSLALDLETYVTGHGPLGSKADVRLQIQDVAALEALAAQVVRAGSSANDAAKQPIPAPFDAWSHEMGLFGVNMRYLHQRLSGK